MGINSPFFKKHKTKKLNVLQEKKKDLSILILPLNVMYLICNIYYVLKYLHSQVVSQSQCLS